MASARGPKAPPPRPPTALHLLVDQQLRPCPPSHSERRTFTTSSRSEAPAPDLVAAATSSIAAICRPASRSMSPPALFLAGNDEWIMAGVITTVSREGCWVSSARQTAWTYTWFPLLQPLWPVVTMRPPVPVRAQIGRLVRERKRQLWLLTPTKLCEGHAHLPWHPSAAEYIWPGCKLAANLVQLTAVLARPSGAEVGGTAAPTPS